MKHFWILITDKKHILVIDDGTSISLPHHAHWPANRPFKRNNMLDALFDHILCGVSKPETKKTKMKRVFGMPPKSCWAIYEIADLEALVKNLKKVKLWWTHNAGASLDWRTRSMEISEFKNLDITSATLVQQFKSAFES
jgi:hypothetical protein